MESTLRQCGKCGEHLIPRGLDWRYWVEGRPICFSCVGVIQAAKLCQRKKCGEYNMLKCVLESGHSDDCCFVVDHANDYSYNKSKKARRRD